MVHMSKMLALIDAYKDTHGQPSDASIARAVGIAPQTISSWRKRGIREMPARTTLEGLSVLMSTPYQRLRDACQVETGYMDISEYEAKWEVGDDGRSAAM